MKWFINSLFGFMFDAFGIIFTFLALFGVVMFAFSLNTPQVPWGVVFLFSLCLIPGYFCVKIIRDKMLTPSEKWKKLLGKNL